MAKHHILLFLGAVALAFFARSMTNSWPGFSQLYTIGYGGAGNMGNTGGTSGT
jgi:hypothetical protein